MSDTDSPSPRGWWPHLRALFVAFHLTAVILAALPAPGGGMNRRAWADPTVQQEFAAWAGRLRAVGVDWTAEELEGRAWNFAIAFMDVRRDVLAPFQPYYRWMGTTQSWRMFVAPHRYPARLWIDVKVGGEWSPVYVARSDKATWRRRQLDDDRMRAALFRYAWPHYSRNWEQLATWLADRAAEDFPEATSIRLRFLKMRTPSPQEVRDGVEPSGRWVNPVVLPLEPRR